MNAPLWTALILAVLATPSPVPNAGSTALREIGRVRANACPSLVRSANIAIMSAMHNDVVVADVVRKLQSVQLDEGPLARVKGLRELGALAANLRTEASRGEKESEHLHEVAARIDDNERRAGLLGFADALAGALARQKRVGRDLQIFIAHAESIVSVTPVETPGPADRALLRNSYQDPRSFNPAPPPDRRGSALGPMAREAADVLNERRSAIDADEARAVDNVNAAFRNCAEPTPAST